MALSGSGIYRLNFGVTSALGQTLASNGVDLSSDAQIDAPLVLSGQSLGSKPGSLGATAALPNSGFKIDPPESPAGSVVPMLLLHQAAGRHHPILSGGGKVLEAPQGLQPAKSLTPPIAEPRITAKMVATKGDDAAERPSTPLLLLPARLKADAPSSPLTAKREVPEAPTSTKISLRSASARALSKTVNRPDEARNPSSPKSGHDNDEILKSELTKFAQAETEVPAVDPPASEPPDKTGEEKTKTPSAAASEKKSSKSKKAKDADPAAQASDANPLESPAAPIADGPAKKQSGKAKQTPLPDTLHEVVSYAIKVSPQIALARGRLGEAKAGVIVAAANNGFQLDGNASTGYGAQSTTTVPLSNELFSQPALGNGKRYILGLTGKKLVYDFGATDTGINRALKLTTAEELNVATRVNDVGHAMAQAYLMVVETRNLAKLNADNIKSLEEILELVKLNQSNGNGTIADVKRVEARLADARTVAADNEAEMQTAIDRFLRLVKSEPGNLKPAPDLADYAPATIESALALLPQLSPKLRSDEALRRAAELDLDAKKSSLKPQVLFETNASMKSYTGSYWNNFDAQALVTMTYKFLDGGLSDGQIGQLSARIEQAQQQAIFDRDEAEADLRKFYVTLASARSKTASLDDGVDASRKAKDLYKEQFQGGKRSLFELLDIQTSAFNAERASILNRFEERRAVYGVLNTLGIFLSAVNGKRETQAANTASTDQTEKSAGEPAAN